MKLRTVIIDDEPLARQILRQHLTTTDVDVVAECSNGFEGIKAIQEHSPDFIFLDIQMPRMSGFEMLELVSTPPIVIFVTAYDEFAIQAFDVNAIDYLLKPFAKERLVEAVDRARQNVAARHQHDERLAGLMRSTQTEEMPLERIAVRLKDEVKIIAIESVLHFEAMDDYVNIHTESRAYLKQWTLKSIESRLNSQQYLRVHRSHIIRLDSVTRIEPLGRDTQELTLSNGSSVPVSRSGYAQLKKFLN